VPNVSRKSWRIGKGLTALPRSMWTHAKYAVRIRGSREGMKNVEAPIRLEGRIRAFSEAPVRGDLAGRHEYKGSNYIVKRIHEGYIYRYSPSKKSQNY